MVDNLVRLLVVDDEPALLAGIKAAIPKDQFEVFVEPDGYQAWRFMQNNPVDVLLTDLIMPTMDGFELIRKVSSAYPDVIIIAMSGGGRYPGSSYLSAAHFFNVQQILEKPFEISTLLDSINRLLKHDE